MNVQVNRLRLKGASESPHHEAFLIEDALNTLLSSEQRLVLVRRVELDHPNKNISAQQDNRVAVARNVAAGWTRIMAGACHGATDSAASANVVWFADLDEAKAILLDRLLKGQSADAWFWRLAVKLWRGQPVADWVAAEMHAADKAGLSSKAIAMIARLLQAGHVATAEAALSLYLGAETEAVSWLPPLRFDAPYPFAADRSENEKSQFSSEQLTEQAAFLQSWIVNLRQKLPAALLHIMPRISATLVNRAPLFKLIENWIVRIVPELTLRPELLQIAAQQIVEKTIDLQARTGPKPVSKTSPAKSHRAANALPDSLVPADNLTAQKQTQPDNKADSTTKADIRVAGLNDPEPEATLTPVIRPLIERPSNAAGLFFLFNPLRELGWPEWLTARPELLPSNPTLQLLESIASHHQIDATDPAFAFLRERAGDLDLPLDPDLLGIWRIAVDRWLRRTARINLHQTARKAGWLTWQDDRLTARFAMQNIDLRLRRQAIDRDPGWLAWAGLSVRFLFSDRSLYQDGHDDN